ncbi:MAG: class 1 fructose-bisphosphatase [Bacteroidota bacterium]|jgi:fructose-1,6-bisphosphatase I
MERSRIALPIGITLDRFIKSKQDEYPNAAGELSQLLRDIALASKVVNREINKAGLVDIMGYIGQQNEAGDEQQKLDVLAHIRFSRALSKGGEAAGIISEETETFTDFKNKGKYVVAIDPLDGSSNIDVNVSIGTIFSIYKRKTKPGTKLTKKDFLQKGTEQVAAGYVLYGSSTMLVYTTGKGVNGFTYETTLGEYVLSHPQMKCPSDGKIYSINEAGLQQYSDPTIERYLTQCKKDGFTARYIGSLVADIHRNMIKGGIFLYPATSKYPNGKLRLLFECNALALIVEQAGGLASNGSKRILEMEPNGLHQTTPMYIGSKQLVKSLLSQSKKK